MTALGKRVIDVPGGSYEQGCNLVIWDKHRGDNQVFFAVRTVRLIEWICTTCPPPKEQGQVGQ